MKRSVFDLLAGGELQPAWVPYGDGVVEILLKPSTAIEQRQRLTVDTTERAREEYWLEHVANWRRKDGATMEQCTPENVRRIWDLDPRFTPFVVAEVQKLETFLGPGGAGPAALAPPDLQG